MNDPLVMTLAVVGGELLLLLLILLTMAYFRSRAAHKRDRLAIQRLVAGVRKARPEREQAVEAFLGGRMQLSGEALEQAKGEMLRAELVLLQRFATIYQGRDAQGAGAFDSDLLAALVPYQSLTATGASGGGEGQVLPDEAAEVAALRSENARMADELRITMETMSRMLNEYSTMFTAGGAGQVPPIAAIAGGASVIAQDDGEEDAGGESAAPDIAVVEGEDPVPAPEAIDGDPPIVPASPADEETVAAVADEMADDLGVPAEAEAQADVEVPVGEVVDNETVGEAVGDEVVVDAEDRQDTGSPDAEPPDPVAAEPEAEVPAPGAAPGTFEEGPVEVVAFDDPDDDAVLEEGDEELFEMLEQQHLLGDGPDDDVDPDLDAAQVQPDAEEPPDLDGEPLKKQSGG